MGDPLSVKLISGTSSINPTPPSGVATVTMDIKAAVA